MSVWLGASAALGRPVPVDGTPYPHICGREVTSWRTGQPVRIHWSRCAACAEGRGRDTPNTPKEP